MGKLQMGDKFKRRNIFTLAGESHQHPKRGGGGGGGGETLVIQKKGETDRRAGASQAGKTRGAGRSNGRILNHYLRAS